MCWVNVGPVGLAAKHIRLELGFGSGQHMTWDRVVLDQRCAPALFVCAAWPAWPGSRWLAGDVAALASQSQVLDPEQHGSQVQAQLGPSPLLHKAVAVSVGVSCLRMAMF